jgi:MFS family permease
VHMVAHGHGLGLVGLIVAVHVAGMFAPSPLSGWVADKVGLAPGIASGFTLVVASGITGVSSDTGGMYWMIAMLTMLGVGWNFGVVGDSLLLATSVPANLRPHVEGLGEVAMGLAAGTDAPIAGLIVTLGGFAALSLAVIGMTVAAAVLVLVVVRGTP